MAGSFESGGVYDFVLREAAAKSIFHKVDDDDSDEDESPQSDDCEARLTAAGFAFAGSPHSLRKRSRCR